MTEAQLYRRLIRRSTYRSRSAAVIVTLTIVALAAVYAGIEVVLAALELPALLISPADALALAELPVAVALAVLGLVLLIVALTPGRRGRHELPNTRMAVIVDDTILAGALSRVVTRKAAVPAARVSSVVSRRRGAVRVTPTSGMPLDQPALETAARAAVATLDPRPALRVAVDIAPAGVVGS